MFQKAEKKSVVQLDKYERRITINALNRLRSDLIDEQRPTDVVNDLLEKYIEAPERKVARNHEAR